MIYYVYIDPEVIRAASREGPYAVQCLIGILRGFLQNCFLLDFVDYRVQNAISDCIDELADPHERKAIKTLLGAMQKRNRFVCALEADYDDRPDVDRALDQARAAGLDLIFVESREAISTAPAGVDVATLADYQITDFENDRSRIAAEGMAFRTGEMTEIEFLDRTFKKALRHASRIEVCDKLFGKFRDNFVYSIGVFLTWLAQILEDPANCSLVIHCGEIDVSENYLRGELAKFKTGRLAGLTIEVQPYGLGDPDHCLPHDRFILTEQVALTIGRGMDFLDRNTQQNRDLVVDYKSRKQVDDILQSYGPEKLQKISI